MSPRLWTNGLVGHVVSVSFSLLAEIISTNDWEYAVVRPSKSLLNTGAANQVRNSEVAVMQPEGEIGSQIRACAFGRCATSLRQETS